MTKIYVIIVHLLKINITNIHQCFQFSSHPNTWDKNTHTEFNFGYVHMTLISKKKKVNTNYVCNLWLEAFKGQEMILQVIVPRLSILRISF